MDVPEFSYTKDSNINICNFCCCSLCRPRRLSEMFSSLMGWRVLNKDRRALILGEVASPHYLNELFASQLLALVWTFAFDVCRERMKARMLSHALFHIQTCHMNSATPRCCKSRPFRFAHISHKHCYTSHLRVCLCCISVFQARSDFTRLQKVRVPTARSRTQSESWGSISDHFYVDYPVTSFIFYVL